MNTLEGIVRSAAVPNTSGRLVTSLMRQALLPVIGASLVRPVVTPPALVDKRRKYGKEASFDVRSNHLAGAAERTQVLHSQNQQAPPEPQAQKTELEQLREKLKAEQEHRQKHHYTSTDLFVLSVIGIGGFVVWSASSAWSGCLPSRTCPTR